MESTRYLYSEIIPRATSEPSLGHIPPRLIHAAQRYGELLQMFSAMSAQVVKAPVVSAQLADISRSNPQLTLDIDDVLPWKNAYELQLLVSEIFHHLRVSADHLIYNVAWLDSGSEQKRTQFPVFRAASDFQSQGLRMLSGVNDTHRGWIEAVQPFNGVGWTEALAYLSNNDKHNYLLEVVPTLSYRIDLHSADEGTDDPETVYLPVDNLKTQLRMIRRDGTLYGRLDKQLAEIIYGFSDLLNQFLRQAGMSEVRIDTAEL